MMKTLALFFFACSFATAIDSCRQAPSTKRGDPAADAVAIAKGETVFDANCSSCHNFRSDGIGPQLGGVTATVNDTWIAAFIKNPQAVINSGDTLAQALLDKFHVVMPSFASLPDSSVNEMLAFLHTKKANKTLADNKHLVPVTDPIPAKIQMSDIKIALKPVTLIPPSSKDRPFTRINKIESSNGVQYVLDMRGKLYVLKNNRPALYLDVAAAEPLFLEKMGLGTGLGSVAFHPGFARNGLIYTTHTEGPRAAKATFGIGDSIKTSVQWVLTEWKASDPAAITFTGTHRELMRIDMVTGMHGVQEICFKPHGKPGDEDYGQLYIGVGDGGCVEAGYPSLAHRPDKVWGAILRIDPEGHNSANGKYGISANNPFHNIGNSVAEIYAYGFRNPNRISWSSDGLMLVSNIGQANIESLNIVHKSDDFGWPLREGPFMLDYEGDMKKIYALPANDSANHFTYPALQFDHDEGHAISGGFEYTGNAATQLQGKYIFGDIVSGRLFMAEMKGLKDGHPNAIREFSILYNGKIAALKNMCGDDRVDLRFAKDSKGELFILTKADGMIYQLKDP